MGYVLSLIVPGPPGPIGPRGIEGDDGADGLAGTSGTSGTAGTPGGMGAVLFGDKSDGTAVFDGTTTILGIVPSGGVYTLSRCMFFDSCTINAGVIIATAGWRLFARTLTNNGRVHCNGGAGGNATGTGPFTAGVAGAAGTPVASPAFYGLSGGGCAGVSGSSGQSGGANNAPSWPGTTIGSVAGGIGVGTVGGVCQGGSGGGGGAGTTGGTGGTTNATTATRKGSPHDIDARRTGRASFVATGGLSADPPWSGGSGGGGGVNATQFARSACGGSGGGGGIVGVFAERYSGSGTIEAKGGDAGTGALDSVDAGGTTPHIGGSAGGGGGVAVVIVGSSALSFATINASVLVTGGLGAPAVINGSAGGNGGDGLKYVDVLS